MSKMTASEYRELMKGKNPPKVPGTIPVKEKPDGRLTTKEALRSMGHYFEIDESKVKFWIRQMELSKKI